MELRGAPRGRDVTETQAETILHAVLDAGINYIDTSIDYGLSEERIGRYLSGRRSEYYLASKCGCLVGASPAPRGQRNPQVGKRRSLAGRRLIVFLVAFPAGGDTVLLVIDPFPIEPFQHVA